jgi:hypothetical protein
VTPQARALAERTLARLRAANAPRLDVDAARARSACTRTNAEWVEQLGDWLAQGRPRAYGVGALSTERPAGWPRGGCVGALSPARDWHWNVYSSWAYVPDRGGWVQTARTPAPLAPGGVEYQHDQQAAQMFAMRQNDAASDAKRQRTDAGQLAYYFVEQLSRWDGYAWRVVKTWQSW